MTPLRFPDIAAGENVRDAASAYIEEWVTRPEFLEAVRAFGGPSRGPAATLRDHIHELADFSALKWENRLGRERNFAQEPELTAREQDIILEAAQALGMIEDTAPTGRRYDHILVL